MKFCFNCLEWYEPIGKYYCTKCWVKDSRLTVIKEDKQMSTKVVVKSSGGMGLLGWLTILFVGLKLTNFITWSWWLVLAPVWLPLAVVGSVAAVLLLVAIIFTAFTGGK